MMQFLADFTVLNYVKLFVCLNEDLDIIEIDVQMQNMKKKGGYQKLNIKKKT